MSDSKRLTILLPTHGRPDILRMQLQGLVDLHLPLAGEGVEILVSDNNADDASVRVCLDFTQRLPLRWVRPATVLQTAEENVFFALRHAVGEYVWTLGDDDAPDRNSVMSLFERVRASCFDAMLWNARMVDEFGLPSREYSILCGPDILEVPFTQFCLRAGFWWEPARMSSWVIRRSVLNPDDAGDWIHRLRSPIYSHVTYLAQALAGRSFAYINQPLVNYRLNDYTRSGQGPVYWNNVHKRLGLPVGFSWTAGFVEQWCLLVDRGLYRHEDLGIVIETTENLRFPLYHLMTYHLVSQLTSQCEGVGEPLTRDDFRSVLDALRRAAPEDFILWHDLGLLFDASLSQSRADKRSTRLALHDWERRLAYRAAQRPYFRFFRGDVHGWSLYDSAMGAFAVPQGDTDALNAVFSHISVPESDQVLRGESLAAVADQARITESPSLRSTQPLARWSGEAGHPWVMRAKRRIPIKTKLAIKQVLGLR